MLALDDRSMPAAERVALEGAGMGIRGEGTRGGSDGPGGGGDGNGTWSLVLLGRLSRERGLGMRSGRLSALRTLKDEADDGARARPMAWGGAGLFWREGAGDWAREDIRGGLCTGGGPPVMRP